MRLAAKQIQDAKIATSAMFLAREEAARRTGLPRANSSSLRFSEAEESLGKRHYGRVPAMC